MKRPPLFLFVRPPRPLWPFNGPESAFWPPLAFASLAASLRQKLPQLSVAVLDAPILHMGWSTLRREMVRYRPDYVGIGEESVSCVEGLRLAAMAKELGARVIAGGCFFGNAAREVIGTGMVDVVVHGEGEATLCELMAAWLEDPGREPGRVAGLSYWNGSEVVQTPPRELIGNLDDLPMPAYDLLPVDRYGAHSRHHPRLASIELGRGCVGTCDFCVVWRQMARLSEGTMRPCLRSKSVERLLEEVRMLKMRYHRHYLGWVDPCFNADPGLPGELAEKLLCEGLETGQSAWMRSDFLLRDLRSGAMDAMVRSGLNEVYVGIERPEKPGLDALNKGMDLQETGEALSLLKQKHPHVTVVGSFIYGLPGDDAQTMRAMHRYASDLDLDQAFYIPLTPLPGTDGWSAEHWDGQGEIFRRFGFVPNFVGNDKLAQLERALVWAVLTQWPASRVQGWIRTLGRCHSRAAGVRFRMAWRGLKLIARQNARAILGLKNQGGMVFPAWYES